MKCIEKATEFTVILSFFNELGNFCAREIDLSLKKTQSELCSTM